MPQDPNKPRTDPYAGMEDPYAAMGEPQAPQPPSTPTFAGTRAAPPGLLSRISPRLAAMVGGDQSMSLNPFEIFKEQSPGEYEQDVRAFGRGGAGVLKGLWQIAMSDPQQFEQILRQGYAGQEQQKDALLKEAEQREAQGQGYQWRLRLMAGGHAMASVLPFVGPGVAESAEKIGRGGPEGGAAQAELLGSFALPKVGGEVLGKGYQGAKDVRELYRATKTGELPPPTPGSLRARLRGLTGASSKLREEVQKAADDYKAAQEKRQKAVEDVAKARQQAEAVPELERIRIDQENLKAEQEYQLAREKYEQAVGQRTQTQRQLDTQATQGKNLVEGVESRVYNEVQQRYNNLREQVGADQPDEPTSPKEPLDAKVREMEETELRGQPESIAYFRNILDLEKGAGYSLAERTMQEVQRTLQQNPGEQPRAFQRRIETEVARRMNEARESGDVQESINWSNLQRTKTAGETFLRSGRGDPTMRYAVGEVVDKATDMMEEIADERGAGTAFKEARDLNRQWREDFHDGPRRGKPGTPLRVIRNQVDPKKIVAGMKGTEGYEPGRINRAVQLLQKYPQYGGNEAAAAVQGVVNLERGLGKAPTAPTRTPAKPFPPAEVPISEATRTPPPVEQQTVDVGDVSRREMERRSKYLKPTPGRTIGIVGGSTVMALVSSILGKNPFENASTAAGGVMGGLAFGWTQSIAGDLLINPEFQRLLAQASPEEIQALNSIPGADRVKVMNGLTDLGVKAARRGIPVRGPILRFIGPGNAAKIAAAAGFAARPPVQTPAEAKQVLGQPAAGAKAAPPLPVIPTPVASGRAELPTKIGPGQPYGVGGDPNAVGSQIFPTGTTPPRTPPSAPSYRTMMRGPAPAGLIEKGNINLDNRPMVPYGGDISTVRSATFGVNENGREITVLLPTVINGRVVSNAEALQHYRDTAEHLGKFDSLTNAEAYSHALHLEQQQDYRPGKPSAGSQ